MLPAVLNFVGFQLVWLANCLGAAAGHPWLGPLLTVIWLSLHFGWFVSARTPEAGLIAASLVFGYVADSLLVIGGFIQFPAHTQLGGPSTLWMVALWAGFASTLRHSLKWLLGRPAIAAWLGAVFGPLAYLAGEGLGAIDLAGTPALFAVAVEWAVSMPVLVLFAARFDARYGRSRITAEGVDPS